MENEHNKLLEVLQIIKEQILQEQWVQTANAISCKIELHLEILLHLPIVYLNSNVKTLVFLIAYSISRECKENDKISTLCNMIFSGNIYILFLLLIFSYFILFFILIYTVLTTLFMF